VDSLVVVLVLMLGVTLLGPLSDRIGVPAPVGLVGFGVVLALLPGVPSLHIPPELALPLILPPLLFAAAQRSTTREFIDNAVPLLSLAVGLVVVTTAVVAVVARLVEPQLGIAAAIALGALVAPPDPIAATSVAARLGLPARLVEVLEGEGLLNDATSLVIYSMAVEAATGGLSFGGGARVLLVSVVAAPLVGYAIARVGGFVLDKLDDARAEVLLTVLMPYAAFLIVDRAGGSGVLAVVVTGLYVGQRGVTSFTTRGFLAGTTVWGVADWVVSGLTFALIGFQLTDVLRDPEVPTSGWGVAAAVALAAVVTRGLFVFPLGFVMRRSRMLPPGVTSSWRASVVVAWAGMRGVVTLATALSLPEDFPGRPVVLLAAIVVVLVTLVGQGLTLPFVARATGITGLKGRDETSETRAVAATAALGRLKELLDAGEVTPENAEALERAYMRYLPKDSELRTHELDDEMRARLDDFAQAARQLYDVERTVVLDLRANGRIGPDAARDLLRDLESRDRRAHRESAELTTEAVEGLMPEAVDEA
jgi:Na+/H+ antiporter